MYLEIFGAVLGLALLYVGYVVCWCQTYWKRRGVYTLKSTFFLGSLGPALLKQKTLKDIILDMYNEALRKNLKYAGIYMSTVPEVMVADPELVREITVKKFDHFTDRQPFAKRNIDDLLAQSLLSLKGEEWRKMRHNLSPAFTGSKLRGMSELMVQTGLQYSRFMVSRANPDEAIDMRNVFRRFAADVIATTAFGTPSNSLDDSDNDFFNNGMKMSDVKGTRMLVVMGYIIAPKLMAALKIPFLPASLKTYFTNIITNTIKFREENNKSRPDMIQMLLEERKGQFQKLKEMGHQVNHPNEVMSDMEILAQAFTFFLAGFETVSALATMTCMVLGGLPDVQEKLRDEVDAAFEQAEGGKLKYETIQEMKYLDNVLSEVLRLIPITAAGDRVCTKDLELPEYNLIIKKGDITLIPFYAFQMDPQYFSDPEEFIPERFNEENKHKIAPFTYMPFGSGPRNCIGNRFALLEVKIAIIYTLAFCDINLNTPDQYPIKLDPKKMDNAPTGGFLLKIKPRENPPISPEILKEK